MRFGSVRSRRHNRYAGSRATSRRGGQQALDAAPSDVDRDAAQTSQDSPAGAATCPRQVRDSSSAAAGPNEETGASAAAVEGQLQAPVEIVAEAALIPGDAQQAPTEEDVSVDPTMSTTGEASRQQLAIDPRAEYVPQFSRVDLCPPHADAQEPVVAGGAIAVSKEEEDSQQQLPQQEEEEEEKEAVREDVPTTPLQVPSKAFLQMQAEALLLPSSQVVNGEKDATAAPLNMEGAMAASGAGMLESSSVSRGPRQLSNGNQEAETSTALVTSELLTGPEVLLGGGKSRYINKLVPRTVEEAEAEESFISRQNLSLLAFVAPGIPAGLVVRDVGTDVMYLVQTMELKGPEGDEGNASHARLLKDLTMRQFVRDEPFCRSIIHCHATDEYAKVVTCWVPGTMTLEHAIVKDFFSVPRGVGGDRVSCLIKGLHNLLMTLCGKNLAPTELVPSRLLLVPDGEGLFTLQLLDCGDMVVDARRHEIRQPHKKVPSTYWESNAICNRIRNVVEAGRLDGKFETPHGSAMTQFVYTCGLMVLFSVGFTFEGKAKGLVEGVGPMAGRHQIPRKGFPSNWTDGEKDEIYCPCTVVDMLLQPDLQRGVDLVWERLDGGKGKGKGEDIDMGGQFVENCVADSVTREQYASQLLSEGRKRDEAEMRRALSSGKGKTAEREGEGHDARRAGEANPVDSISDKAEKDLRQLATNGKGSMSFDVYMSNYNRYDRIVGTGSNSTVQVAQLKDGITPTAAMPKFVAIKRIEVNPKPTSRKGVEEEASIMVEISGLGFAVPVLHYSINDREALIVMPLFKHTLSDVYASKETEGKWIGADPATQREIVTGIARQLLIAVKTMKWLDVAHCDVKSDNIMASWDGQRYVLQFIDWGLACKNARKGPTGPCGTVGSVPPEMVARRMVELGSTVDAFACGAVICQGTASMQQKEGVSVLSSKVAKQVTDCMDLIPETMEEQEKLDRDVQSAYRGVYPRHVEDARLAGLLGSSEDTVSALGDLVGDDPVRRVAVLDKNVYATFPLPGERPQRGVWGVIKRVCTAIWRFVTGRGGAQARAQRQREREECSRRHVY